MVLSMSYEKINRPLNAGIILIWFRLSLFLNHYTQIMADYKKLIPFIRQWEGGLSKAKTDFASKYPVPDGSGYHTNKGVTWKTFEGLSEKLEYDDTPELFYEMPDWLWERIWKGGFWDSIGGDQIKSQGIADYLADYSWASGPVRPGESIRLALEDLGHPGTKPYLRPITASLVVSNINVVPATQLLTKLNYHRKYYVKNIPNSAANQVGWMNRIDKLFARCLKCA